MTDPWHQKGLKFTCSECGDCCTGAPGYVWVNKAEIERLAALLKLEVEAFEQLYVRSIGIRKSLVEFSNGDCVFFDGEARKCTVYEARPRQCRSWPFWKSNLRTPEAWADTCVACPGSGRGKLHSIEQIEQQAEMLRI